MIYDTFQKKAIDYIEEGYSVIVSAPTGAGKTAIAEYVIRDSLVKRKRAIYTAPIKALSNQKFRDFRKVFKERIGILTGDVSINPQADILILTTEIFRNKLLEKKGSLDSYSWIIFDEVHYLDDYQRGSVWEESLIFLPEHIKVLALSATIPNIDELADWFHSIHKRPLKVVKEEKRPVPLHFFYQFHGEIFDGIDSMKEGRYIRRSSKPRYLIRHLYEENRLPCIYFTFGRRRCEYLAREMLSCDFVGRKERGILRQFYRELCERFELTGEKSAALLQPLVEKGIAHHHAGMLPTLKEVVERLFTSRLIKVIFTTETFALGINMPARTVVFDELRKYYGRYYTALKVRDFYQMAGRAGRRGMDREGYVYSRINSRYTSFRELKAIIYGEPESVTSKFNASYATVLNLYRRYGERLYDIYPLSFHSYQQKRRFKRQGHELLRSKVRILKELGLIREGTLTEEGTFASKIYGYELSLTEFFKKNFLERLSDIELGILCLAQVFEPRKNSRRPKLPKRTRRLQNKTDETLHYIHDTEKRHKIMPLSKRYFYHLSPCLEEWMRNEPFDKILRYTNADEGEVIRYFRMCVQILREILDTPASLALKEKIHRAINLINRDVVNARRQLMG